MITGDEKWVTYDNIVRKRSSSKHGEAAQTVAKPGLTSRKVLPCIWVGYVQWTTPPPVLRVEQSTLTSHPVRNVRLKDTRENTQTDVRDAKL
ncbi:hypothetical protein TNCV_4942291 [Trichonephila clavipes]|nr:hypothetical protein TNCV_4942291 [Trichonephila clavipes]